MRSRRGELTLAGQFLVLQLVVVALLLGIVAVLSLRQSTADFTDERGAQMRSVGEYVAGLPPLRTHLAAARTDDVKSDDTRRTLAPYVDRGVQLSGADDVLVVGLDGEVLAASDPSLVGTEAELGGSDATGGRLWSGDIEVDGERVVAAHAPIYSWRGAVLGIVVAQQAYPSVWERLTEGATDLAVFLGAGALLGIAGSLLVSRVVKRGTRGLAATEIANLADQRQALLHAIREGVVAVGTDGRVTMANDAARATLGLDGPDGMDPVGRRVDELGLDPHVVDLLSGASGGEDAVALVGHRVVVFNRREASARGRGIGSVTTLRDRTELVSLQSQLSSNLSITDTLRAQTHEFDNRLHTISGLVQLEEYDEVSRLLGTLTRRRAEVSEAVSKRLSEPALAALVIAKHAVAEERGVTLDLDPGSAIPQLPPDLVADLTTVLGNLVDNAVDACAGMPGATVELWLIVARDAVQVRVRDNGPGVPDSLADTIFVRGFSTKPDVVGGRGIGLPLVRLICHQRGGEVTLAPASAGPASAGPGSAGPGSAGPGSGGTDGPGSGGAEFRAVLPLVRPPRQDEVP